MHTLEDISGIVTREIAALRFPAEPALLYAPIRYTLEGGGKRIRPVLSLGTCALFTDELPKAIPAAMAIEVFHNFTLLHDDIMDNSSLRRGRPTVHVKWDENAAILSGDAMLIYAYELAAQAAPEKLFYIMPVLNRIFMGVCEGQQYDMEFESRDDVTAEEYLKMIALKTALLFAGAMQVGAVLGGAEETVARQLDEVGMNLGMAFQLQDDLLDTYGDTAVLGKNTGGDIVSNKKTFLLIKALELARNGEREKLVELLSSTDLPREEKIEKVKTIYTKSGAKALTEKLVGEYFEKATVMLNDLPVEEARKATLRDAMELLIGREK